MTKGYTSQKAKENSLIKKWNPLPNVHTLYETMEKDIHRLKEDEDVLGKIQLTPHVLDMID